MVGKSAVTFIQRRQTIPEMRKSRSQMDAAKVIERMIMNDITKKLFYCLALTGSVNVTAGTINASSCGASDVQSALNRASPGDTVQLPAGTCSWSSGVSLNAPANVTLKGAGSTNVMGGGDKTIIVDNYRATNGALLKVNVNSSGLFRMTGLTFRNGNGGLKNTGMIQFTGPGNLRIDHVHIDMTTGTTHFGKYLYIGGGIRGVMDNTHIETKSINWIHIVNGSGYAGDLEWSKPTGFGSSDFFFIEDSIADNSGSVEQWYRGTLTDCHTGGKFVVRYNSLIATAPAQTHPTGHGGDDRGCRAHEVYKNTVTSPGLKEPNFAFDYNNSGPAMTWGNSFDDVFKNIMYFNICRGGQSDCGYTQSAPPNGWGNCGSSSWDEGGAGACIDQPGRGQGDLISGLFPNKVNIKTGSPSWPNQALEPVYEWDNVGETASGWGGSWLTVGDKHIQQNRDFYLGRNNTSCDKGAASCSAGVGSGSRSQRPANCISGVAWWSTDQGGNWNTANNTSNDGTLDVCTANNKWVNAVYTPYTYPHPLREESGNNSSGLQTPPALLRTLEPSNRLARRFSAMVKSPAN